MYGVGSRHVVKSVREEGPWALVFNGSHAEVIRVTACFVNLGAPAVTLDMYSSWDNLEPKMSWEDETRTYDTQTSRRQLGASLTPGTAEDRGVLTLAPRSQWKEFPLITTNWWADWAAWLFSISLSNTMVRPRPVDETKSSELADRVVILSNTDKGYVTSAHETHMELFQDTLRATESSISNPGAIGENPSNGLL